MYKVVKKFQDLQDNRYSYQVGDIFPRDGMKVSKERLEELSSINNRRHTPLIKLIEEPKVEKVKEIKVEPKVEEIIETNVEPEIAEEKIEETIEETIAEPEQIEQPVKKSRKNRRNKEK